MTSPQLVVNAPHPCRRKRRGCVESKPAPKRKTLEMTMPKTDRPDINVNAELARSFEPLRVVFALSALLLGVIASLRF